MPVRRDNTTPGSPAQGSSTAGNGGGADCPFSGDFSDAGLSPTGCPVSPNASAFDPFEGPFQIDPAESLRWSRD